ncbi:ABC transporter ATP-binding protein [Sodalinema gerasimenkoae]|uniref:ABC transporter ATP-binding protein n=1 Tax=Sodalinema gerasimenkoae TaxID=2862348 RepID=UPI001FED171E|nr:ABC transporter ATP-binding protein [Sodalinema gerasimenkoae]
MAIAATGVEMSYLAGHKRIQILKQVDLMIERGQVQLLMGPSGSGKTTLLSILAGLLAPTAGSVCLLGEEITRMSRQQLSQFRLNRLGFIFQGFNLFPALTAAENVEVALNLQGIHGRNARQSAQEMLERVGLGDKGQNRPRDLSGGQKQRVAIARALVTQPEIVMADEPTAALDSKSGHAVMELLRRLAIDDDVTVLMVTHDPRILDVADSVTYLEDGEIREK